MKVVVKKSDVLRFVAERLVAEGKLPNGAEVEALLFIDHPAGTWEIEFSIVESHAPKGLRLVRGGS